MREHRRLAGLAQLFVEGGILTMRRLAGRFGYRPATYVYDSTGPNAAGRVICQELDFPA